MTREQLMARLVEWIAEITDGKAPPFTESSDLVKDVGLDSLALAELAAKLRHALQIKVRPGELHGKLQVSLLLDLVQERLGGRTP